MKNNLFNSITLGILFTVCVATSYANKSGIAVCEEFNPGHLPKTAKCSVEVKNKLESLIFNPHYLVVNLSKSESVGPALISGSASFNLLGTDGKSKYDVPNKGQGTLTVKANMETHGNNPYNCQTQLFTQLKLEAGSCTAAVNGSVIQSNDENCNIEAFCIFE